MFHLYSGSWGVIENVHYGDDELVWVADVRNQFGVFSQSST